MKNKKTIVITFLIMIAISVITILPHRVEASNDIIVMLDPGHGGTETGAVGGGLVEKNLTWKLATKVKEILDRTPGITGILTKQDGETLGRQERANRAKANEADLLVSFHINSNESSNRLSGAEVYITHNTTQKRYYEYSNVLGLNILQNLRNVGVPSFSYRPKVRVGTPNDVYADGTIADYYGIISCPMHYGIPGVLIEHCFINNPYDRENYLNDTMLSRMAQADADAIIANKERFRRTYYGQINTVLQSINLIKNESGTSYLKGTIDIAEWVDNNCNKPKEQPILTLKSTDGSVSKKIYSYWMQGITYYYDIFIDNLDPNKEYYIEAYLTSQENIAPIQNKTQKVWLPEKTFGEGKNGTISAKNNQFYFTYEGEIVSSLNNIQVIKSNGIPFITGSAKVEEIIKNKKYLASGETVTFMLETTDNSFSKKLYSYDQGKGNFYFDTKMDDLDKDKEYKIIGKINNVNNLASSNKKEKQINLPQVSIIGNLNDTHLLVENNVFKITDEYKAKIETKLQNISMSDNGKGRHYISGNIQIKEKVDNKSWISTVLPELMLKGENGYSQKMYIHHAGNGNYYFDTYIEDLDKTKQYYIEAQLINTNNTATKTEKTEKVVIENVTLGKIKDYKVMIDNSNLKFMDASLYIGNINTKVQNISMNDNGKGKHYISGNVTIKEKVEGKLNLPTTLPSLTLKGENGYSQKMYIHHAGNGNYYFDTYIEDLDRTKQYYIEAELTNIKNIAEKKQKVQVLKIGDKGLGKIKEQKVIFKNNQLQFVEANQYEGIIYTHLTNDIYLKKNELGKHYISGNMNIIEKIEGKETIPTTLPSLTLKSEDGYAKKMYIYHSGNGNYYFDTYIEDLDKTKQYYIEASLTNKNNISNQKTKKVILKEQVLGKIKEQKVITKNNYILFKEDNYEGKITTKLTEGIYLKDNGVGKHYICGNIQIKEIVEGKSTIPTSLPELTLRSDDGYSQKMYIYHSGNGNYYFDTYIEDLDNTKEYYIQARLTSNKNIASENNKKQNIVMKNKRLGETRKNIVSIVNNKISLQLKS